MKRPRIGITMDSGEKPNRYGLPCDYAKSVERAGGLPILLAYRTDLSLIPEMLDLLDGVLFSGGDDLNPALYGELWHPEASQIDPVRQTFELALIAEVERRSMPALGVCLGSQLMNVHRGGSLIQFIPDLPGKLEHRRLDDPSRRHPVTLDPESKLAKAVGKTEIIVNTRHKQAIAKVGNGLRVIATAPDGIIEGVEDPDRAMFMAVQWHPENLSERPEHLAPFKLLVDAAK